MAIIIILLLIAGIYFLVTGFHQGIDSWVGFRKAKQQLRLSGRAALYDEADRLKDAGKLEEAAALLMGILAKDPDYALAHSALAVIYTRMNRHDEAVSHGLRACKLEPNDPVSFTALSVTYEHAGRVPEAEEAMARARTMTTTS